MKSTWSHGRDFQENGRGRGWGGEGLMWRTGENKDDNEVIDVS